MVLHGKATHVKRGTRPVASPENGACFPLTGEEQVIPLPHAALHC
jgi:hypothetical protein